MVLQKLPSGYRKVGDKAYLEEVSHRHSVTTVWNLCWSFNVPLMLGLFLP